MFLYFSLAFSDPELVFVGSVGGNKHASTHGHANKLPARQTTTFDSVLRRFCKATSGSTDYYGHEHSRTILINLDDADMFQLEALCVSEYSHCTFNLETKKIGFGNDQKQAERATYSSTVYRRKQPPVTGAAYGQEEYTMFNFYPEHMDRKDVDEWLFQCPDNFYQQLYDALSPYIVYEKQYMFKNTFDVLRRESEFVKKFVAAHNNYFENEDHVNKLILSDQYVYTGSTVEFYQSYTSFKLFMDDDVDIAAITETDKTSCCGSICFQLQQLVNETF